MINWLTKALSFMGLNQWMMAIIGLLLVSTAAAGYLLKNSYIENGKIEAVSRQWEQSAKNWKQSRDTLSERHDQLQLKMIEREKEREAINNEYDILKGKLNELEDESGCLDVDLGKSFWLSLDPNNP